MGGVVEGRIRSWMLRVLLRFCIILSDVFHQLVCHLPELWLGEGERVVLSGVRGDLGRG